MAIRNRLKTTLRLFAKYSLSVDKMPGLELVVELPVWWGRRGSQAQMSWDGYHSDAGRAEHCGSTEGASTRLRGSGKAVQKE